jgi:hypothetical protein
MHCIVIALIALIARAVRLSAESDNRIQMPISAPRNPC